jgi:hypothetical protein
LPIAYSNASRRFEKVRHGPVIEFALPVLSRGEKGVATVRKFVLQLRDKVQGLGRENLAEFGRNIRENLYAMRF